MVHLSRGRPARRKLIRLDVPLRVLNTPTLALILGFSLLPILYIGYLSLQDLRLDRRRRGFVGWENYRFVLSDASVVNALKNTVYFSVLSVAIATLVGLGIALLLESDAPGTGWLVLAAVLPWAVPEIVNALMWQWIYNRPTGR